MTKRNIKIGNKNINYNYEGSLNAKEIVEIESSIKGAYHLAEKSIALVKGNAFSSHFEEIFGKPDALKQRKISDAYHAITKKIESTLKIIRMPKFISKAKETKPEVLASADAENGKTIRIFDAFFNEAIGDDKNLNDRPSVIMHEVAHLAGLTGDCEENSTNSAECLRNFTILACEIAKPENLFSSQECNEENPAENKNSQIGIFGDLPYNPNHQPKGQPNGGQFAPKDGANNAPANNNQTPKPASKENSANSVKDSSSENSSAENSNREENALSSNKIGVEEMKKNRETIKTILDEAPKKEYNIKMNEDSFSTDRRKETSDNELMANDNPVPEERQYIWATIEANIPANEPNTDYTIWFQAKYTYTDPQTGEIKTETAEWVYDEKSKENGNIILQRIGIINQDPQNSVQNYMGGDMDIEVNIAMIKGKVRDNFGSPDRVNWIGSQSEKPDYINNKNDPDFEFQKEYGLGSYGAAHAYQHLNGIGGGVNDRVPKNKPESSDKISFHVDGEKGSLKTSREFDHANTSDKSKKSGKTLIRE